MRFLKPLIGLIISRCVPPGVTFLAVDLSTLRVVVSTWNPLADVWEYNFAVLHLDVGWVEIVLFDRIGSVTVGSVERLVSKVTELVVGRVVGVVEVAGYAASYQNFWWYSAFS